MTKRQQGTVGYFLTSSAAVVRNSTLASPFTISSGELFSGGISISVNYPGNASALFQSGTSGNITTSFSNVGNVFMWNNPAFPNAGKATYCLQGELLHVIFDGSSIENCVPCSLYSLPCMTHPKKIETKILILSSNHGIEQSFLFFIGYIYRCVKQYLGDI